MERNDLNTAERLILDDIMKNPGTSISGVAQRCVRSYRKTYVKDCVTRLKTLGYVEDKRTENNMAVLYAAV